MAIEFRVNGKAFSVSDDCSEEGLLEYLREDLDLTGAKNGCHIGVCGACTVIIDDKAMRACMRKLKHVDGKSVETVESMSDGDHLHPLQESFVQCGAIQCGFCTPGMLMSSYALLRKNVKPTREQIRKALVNNLCRCTGYVQVVDAVEQAAGTMRGE